MKKHTPPPTLSLLQFFRTGRLHTVSVGTTHHEVQRSLGQPDWIHKYENNEIHGALWYYNGFQLMFSHETGLLQLIDIKPGYWTTPRSPIKVDWWIFRRCYGKHSYRPVYQHKLKQSLQRHRIPYRDTGMLVVIRDPVEKISRAVPSTTVTGDYDDDDYFVTLVLRSGVDVRYGRDGAVIRASVGGGWIFSGGEDALRQDAK